MPQVQSKNPVLARDLVDAMLSALDTVPGAALLVTPKVKLFTAGPNPILPTTVPADFTEATFTGYAAAALTLPLLGPVNIDANDRAVHHEVDFVAGAVVAPGETILGYWVDDDVAAPTKMYFGEIFENPIAISALGDYISLDVAVPGALSYSLST